MRGSVLPELVQPLIEVLAPDVEAPWWFGLWAGFSSVQAPEGAGQEFGSADRRYRLLEGRPRDTRTSLSALVWQTPNLWWDGTHGWLVHCDVDRSDTFVACTADVADRLTRALPDFDVALVSHGSHSYPLPDHTRV